jgi:hypothetical protein
MLLQVDGSRHQWLGPDGPWLTLVGAIDDATGDVPYAVFREQEDAQGYLLLLREVVRKRGVPLALYSDRHMIFQSAAKEPLTLEEELAGKPLPTQVGGVLAELDITWIGARSPQAKVGAWNASGALFRTASTRSCDWPTSAPSSRPTLHFPLS